MTIAEVRVRLSSVQIAALTMYGEASGEPVEGQIAVLNTIRNRVSQRLQTWTVIALEPQQYSCWNDGPDPNHQRVMLLAEQCVLNSLSVNVVLRQCLGLAALAGDGTLLDNTKGATHYLTRELFATAPPSWISGRLPVCQYGHHLFFKGIAPYK